MQEYSLLLIAYFAGSFISRSTLHSSILSRAYTPTVIQLVNMIFWLLNLKYALVDNFYAVFFLTIWCGFPGGTAYSNFLYLANTRSNLKCDFNLHFIERELTVNLLLISNDLGMLMAGVLGFVIQANYFPDTLYNPPNRL
jgi:hypothetical protein